MKSLRYVYIAILCTLLPVASQAESWKTHFAYNNVTQIAMSPNKVFAISDGNLFCVDKTTEQITVYNRQSGLHDTGITCIYYDGTGNQLIIAYGNGKIDILSSNGVQYIRELYDKDMTQRKTIYNVTIVGRMAYLATHYGVQTLNLRENKLVDSYWLRPAGQEIAVQDVVVTSDSIYAFTTDSMFCAALTDNLVDYTYWKRELRSGRVSPDTEKGTHYQDATSDWYAGHTEGIIRQTATQRLTYKPQGPSTNIPYRLTAAQGKVWVVPGGRWAVQMNRPGVVMSYDGERWTNIETDYIKGRTGNPALDFMNVAVDPQDNTHYFVTSYGTGLYEFKNDSLVRQYLPGEDNSLISAAASNPWQYTRLDCAIYDADHALWFCDAVNTSQLQCIDSNREWHAVNLYDNNEPFLLATPAGLIIDHRNANHKWIGTARYNTSLCILNDNGTHFDESDDQWIRREQWTNQHGASFKANEIYAMLQDDLGRMWIGTDAGAAYIDANTDYFQSDAIVQPDIMDDNGENPITSLPIKAICQAANGDIWLGTDNLGIYVLNPTATAIVAQYTTANSAMPANAILSLVCDEQGKIWIGTADGLVEYDPNGSGEGLHGNTGNENVLDLGSMGQWKLHLSYSDAKQVEATPRTIYAISQTGSLYGFNRENETIDYWSKATGLNGSTISCIAYDRVSEKLVVGYEDGRIDLIDKEGVVTQMPDIYLKAGTISTSINNITVGTRYTYLAMPFGIVAIDARKNEISDTYYIGAEAGSVDVRYIVELSDSLFAFGDDKMYSAALKDNLVDYTFWHASSLPTNHLQYAGRHHDQLYTLQHDSLYRWQNQQWQLIRPEAFEWIHCSEGQLLAYIGGQGLFQLTDDDQLVGLTNQYYLRDAIYSQGEYWLGETNFGLIRLNAMGDDYYHTEGPNSNSGYSMLAAHGRIYTTAGGRWSTEYARSARYNIYDGQNWSGRNEGYFSALLGIWVRDAVSIAVDRSDPSHYMMATYGSGAFEFRGNELYKHHNSTNSTIRPVNETIDPLYYTRTDGAFADESGNFWILNATSIGKPLHILSPDGVWHAMNVRCSGQDLQLITPTGIWPDKRDARYKWFMDQRYSQGLLLLYDGGTPTYSGDDYCVKHSTFVDQNNATVAPTQFRCFAQDNDSRVWIGTDRGLFVIPAAVDFFTSNACRRIIIPRNDGSGLGDYLLGEEQINCLAVDGGNRMWIGTANSGLYLIEDDTITVAQFTETNSLLPSNNVLSIAIEPTTGEVFVGTERGIASYRSDASEAQEDMKNAYAFPNPVRPDYGGLITITGLMENTTVNIVDAGGNLVCKTRSNGGTAIWDGKDAYGKRATPGVYTALCNAGKSHTVVKILVIR